MNQTAHSLEPLEARIAPAAIIFVNPETARFTDLDGDHVTVHFSKPILTQSNLTLVVMVADGIDGTSINEINLNNASGAAGTNISVTVKKAGGGDGLTDVRFIDAGSLDLGTVKIQGNISELIAGSGGASNVAVRSLDVQTLGLFREATDGDTGLQINGQLGALKVAGDLNEIPINVFDNAFPANAKIGSFFIGGTALGSAISAGGGAGSVHVGSINDATITIAGSIGPVSIPHGILFDFNATGPAIVSSSGGISSLSIGGTSSLLATVQARGDIGPVHLTGEFSGSIKSTDGSIGAVSVSGSLPGQLDSQGDLGAVNITGDLTGGLIVENGKIMSVTVGGSIVNGGLSASSIGPVKVGHDLNLALDAGLLIECGTLASLTVGGSVLQSFADTAIATVNGSLGPVRIAHDFVGAAIKQPENFADAVSIKIGGSILDGGLITTDGSLGAVSVGGSLDGSILAASGAIASVHIGGTVGNTSTIEADTSLGPVKIGQNLADHSIIKTLAGDIGAIRVGESITGEAAIEAHTNLASLAVGRNIDMANQNGEKTVFTDTGDIGPVTVGGDMTAGAQIDAHHDLQSISVRGDLELGSIITTDTGAIDAFTIGGSLRGDSTIRSQTSIGAGTIGGDVVDSSLVVADGDLASLKIHGSLLSDEESSVISVFGNLASLTLSGGMNGTSLQAGPMINAGALGTVKFGASITNATIASNTNIHSVAISGNMNTSTILTQPTAGLHETIGTVSVSGNLVASNIVSGVQGVLGTFGNNGDKLIAASSTISKIIIGGTVEGKTGKNFAFEAQELTSITIHGTAIPLTPGPSNDGGFLPVSSIFAAQVRFREF